MASKEDLQIFYKFKKLRKQMFNNAISAKVKNVENDHKEEVNKKI